MTGADLLTVAHLAPVLERLSAIERHLATIAKAQPTTWIPLAEAKRQTGRDGRTIVSAIERGEIVGKRIGRRWLVDMASLRPVTDEAVAKLAAKARA